MLIDDRVCRLYQSLHDLEIPSVQVRPRKDGRHVTRALEVSVIEPRVNLSSEPLGIASTQAGKNRRDDRSYR
jgi:hypothetical protein